MSLGPIRRGRSDVPVCLIVIFDSYLSKEETECGCENDRKSFHLLLNTTRSAVAQRTAGRLIIVFDPRRPSPLLMASPSAAQHLALQLLQQVGVRVAERGNIVKPSVVSLSRPEDLDFTPDYGSIIDQTKGVTGAKFKLGGDEWVIGRMN